MGVPVSNYRLFFIFLTLFPNQLLASQIYHQLEVKIEPSRSFLEVVDEISLTAELCQKGSLNFRLHKGLNPQSQTPGVQIKKIKDLDGNVPTEIYQLSFPKATCLFSLSYQGIINHPPTSDLSSGTISSEGVFLGHSTYWYPHVQGELVSFKLDAMVPPSWSVVSQGDLISSSSRTEKNFFSWQELNPQDDIYIIAGEFHYYSKQGVDIKAEAYLREDNPQLAKKYLDATLDYLKLYGNLIGPYPYRKFALIENFWETGYGMPSFTLLGPSVIQLPFILYTSYPHEILHNWWGNGVYVDYTTGNWSEGLTSYLADHYFKEQQGKGHEYRRDALNNYSSYVDETNDFPLSKFTGRYDKISSAIGYGKVMMFFHMLRVQLGDSLFFKSLSHFYSKNIFKPSSYADIKQSFEKTSGLSLEPIFSQWVEQTGAPKIQITSAKLNRDENSWNLEFELTQVQKGQAYQLFIPYQITLENGEIQSSKVSMSKRAQSWKVNVSGKPKSLIVDPRFDVFRHLNKEEVPSSLAQGYGEKSQLTILLPSKSLNLESYRSFAESLRTRYPMGVNVVEDSSMSKLPKEGSVWILGWQSEFSSSLTCLFKEARGEFSKDKVVIEGKSFEKSKVALVVTLNDPQGACAGESQDRSIIWTGFNDGIDPLVLSQKIFHYGSYSYIGFDLQLKNNLKGKWPVYSSPLMRKLK